MEKIKWEKVYFPKDGILHTRINKELLEQLKKKAEEKNRTLSNLVETILLDYLEKENKMYKLEKRYDHIKTIHDGKEFDTLEELISYCYATELFKNDIEIPETFENHFELEDYISGDLTIIELD